jgi:hypothetical protein
MVEELSALEAAWRAVYEAPEVAADAGVIWHEQLARVLGRLEEWNAEHGTISEHRPVLDYDHPTDLRWPRDPSLPSSRWSPSHGARSGRAERSAGQFDPPGGAFSERGVAG